MQHALKEAAESLVEGRAERLIRERLGEVFGSEQPVSHRTPDGGRETRLVLRDRTLEELDLPPLEECGCLIRMEEHPDGDGVG